MVGQRCGLAVIAVLLLSLINDWASVSAQTLLGCSNTGGSTDYGSGYTIINTVLSNAYSSSCTSGSAVVPSSGTITSLSIRWYTSPTGSGTYKLKTFTISNGYISMVSQTSFSTSSGTSGLATYSVSLGVTAGQYVGIYFSDGNVYASCTNVNDYQYYGDYTATSSTMTSNTCAADFAVSISTTSVPSGCSFPTQSLALALYSNMTAVSVTCGNAATSFSVSPSLPTGLSLDNTGKLSGIPTTAQAVTSYTVTPSNSYGAGSTFDISIQTVSSLLGCTFGPSASYVATYYTYLNYYTPSLTSSDCVATSNYFNSPSSGYINAITVRWYTAPSGSGTYKLKTLSIASSGYISFIAESTFTPYASAGLQTLALTSSLSISSGVYLGLYSTDGQVATLCTTSSTHYYYYGDYTYTQSTMSSTSCVLDYQAVVASGVTPQGCSFSSSSSSLTLTSGSVMTSMTPSCSTTAASGWSIAPALPTGLSFDTSAGTISGTPSQLQASATYSVTPSNSFGSGAPILINIAVVSSGTALGCSTTSTSLTQNYGAGYTFVNIYIPYLPSSDCNPSSGGYAAAQTSGFITSVKVQWYTAPSGSGTYKVKVFSYSSSGYFTLVGDSAVTGVTATGGVQVYSVPNLPIAAGQYFAFYCSDGAPASTYNSGAQSYVYGNDITSTGSTYSFSFEYYVVDIQAIVSATSPTPSGCAYVNLAMVLFVSTAMDSTIPSCSGTAATSFSISPSLPSGLSFDSTTGTISGTPTQSQSLTYYTVTPSNAQGNGGTISITITVSGSPLVGCTTTGSSSTYLSSAYLMVNYYLPSWGSGSDCSPSSGSTAAVYSGYITSLSVYWYSAPTGSGVYKLKVFSYSSSGGYFTLVSDTYVLGVTNSVGLQTYSTGNVAIAAGQYFGFYASDGSVQASYSSSSSYASYYYPYSSDVATSTSSSYSFSYSSYTFDIQATISPVQSTNVPTLVGCPYSGGTSSCNSGYTYINTLFGSSTCASNPAYANSTGYITSVVAHWYSVPSGTGTYKIKVFTLTGASSASLASEYTFPSGTVRASTGLQILSVPSSTLAISPGQYVGFYFTDGLLYSTYYSSYDMSYYGDYTASSSGYFTTGNSMCDFGVVVTPSSSSSGGSGGGGGGGSGSGGSSGSTWTPPPATCSYPTPLLTLGLNTPMTLKPICDLKPTNFSIVPTSLPAGLSFTPSTGLISGTPSVESDYYATYTATSWTGTTVGATFTLSIRVIPSFAIGCSASASYATNTGIAVGGTTYVNVNIPSSTTTCSSAISSNVAVVPVVSQISNVTIRWTTPPSLGASGVYKLKLFRPNPINPNQPKLVAEQRFDTTGSVAGVNVYNLSSPIQVGVGTFVGLYFSDGVVSASCSQSSLYAKLSGDIAVSSAMVSVSGNSSCVLDYQLNLVPVNTVPSISLGCSNSTGGDSSSFIQSYTYINFQLGWSKGSSCAPNPATAETPFKYWGNSTVNGYVNSITIRWQGSPNGFGQYKVKIVDLSASSTSPSGLAATIADEYALTVTAADLGVVTYEVPALRISYGQFVALYTTDGNIYDSCGTDPVGLWLSYELVEGGAQDLTSASCIIDFSVTIDPFKDPNLPLGCQYSLSSVSFVINKMITAITPICPNATSYAITPDPPTGMNFDPYTGILSGTPQTNQLSTQYQITPSNSHGDGDTFNISISIISGKLGLVGCSSTYGYTSVSPTTGGSTFINYQLGSWALSSCSPSGFSAANNLTGYITALTVRWYTAPSGAGTYRLKVLSVSSTSANAISSSLWTQYSFTSGTVTATTGLQTYTIPDGVLYIYPGQYVAFYASDGQVYGNCGGTAVGYSLTSDLSSSSANWVQSRCNRDFQVTVVGQAPVGCAYDSKLIATVVGQALSMIKPRPTCIVAATQFSITPQLPSGLSFNPYFGNITGVPKATLASTTYIVTPYNANGAGNNFTITILVTQAVTSTLVGCTTPVTNSPTTYRTTTVLNYVYGNTGCTAVAKSATASWSGYITALTTVFPNSAYPSSTSTYKIKVISVTSAPTSTTGSASAYVQREYVIPYAAWTGTTALIPWLAVNATDYIAFYASDALAPVCDNGVTTAQGQFGTSSSYTTGSGQFLYYTGDAQGAVTMKSATCYFPLSFGISSYYALPVSSPFCLCTGYAPTGVAAAMCGVVLIIFAVICWKDVDGGVFFVVISSFFDVISDVLYVTTGHFANKPILYACGIVLLVSSVASFLSVFWALEPNQKVPKVWGYQRLKILKLDSLFKFVIYLVTLLSLVAIHLVYWPMILFLGLAAGACKAFSVQQVVWYWVYAWSGENNTNDGSDISLNKRSYNALFLAHLLMESIPQLTLQIINNQLLGAWSQIAYFSAALSILSLLQLSYKFIYFMGCKGMSMADVELGNRSFKDAFAECFSNHPKSNTVHPSKPTEYPSNNPPPYDYKN